MDIPEDILQQICIRIVGKYSGKGGLLPVPVYTLSFKEYLEFKKGDLRFEKELLAERWF